MDVDSAQFHCALSANVILPRSSLHALPLSPRPTADFLRFLEPALREQAVDNDMVSTVATDSLFTSEVDNEALTHAGSQAPSSSFKDMQLGVDPGYLSSPVMASQGLVCTASLTSTRDLLAWAQDERSPVLNGGQGMAHSSGAPPIMGVACGPSDLLVDRDPAVKKTIEDVTASKTAVC
ncbi:hypothetical protein MHYP_G00332500 [Metynnis hypsauchen]